MKCYHIDNKDAAYDYEQKAKVSTFPLELLVGTVKVNTATCPQSLINSLSKTSISPRLFLVK